MSSTVVPTAWSPVRWRWARARTLTSVPATGSLPSASTVLRPPSVNLTCEVPSSRSRSSKAISTSPFIRPSTAPWIEDGASPTIFTSFTVPLTCATETRPAGDIGNRHLDVVEPVIGHLGQEGEALDVDLGARVQMQRVLHLLGGLALGVERGPAVADAEEGQQRQAGDAELDGHREAGPAPSAHGPQIGHPVLVLRLVVVRAEAEAERALVVRVVVRAALGRRVGAQRVVGVRRGGAGGLGRVGRRERGQLVVGVRRRGAPGGAGHLGRRGSGSRRGSRSRPGSLRRPVGTVGRGGSGTPVTPGNLAALLALRGGNFRYGSCGAWR